jgi:hypothetical protein
MRLFIACRKPTIMKLTKPASALGFAVFLWFSTNRKLGIFPFGFLVFGFPVPIGYRNRKTGKRYTEKGKREPPVLRSRDRLPVRSRAPPAPVITDMLQYASYGW